MSNTSKAAAATMVLLISAVSAHASPFEFGGFYAGGHIAYADLEADFDSGGNLDDSGSFGGLQAGYNFTWGSFVWGVETDFSLANASPGGTCPYDATLSCDISAGPMATLRPRIGYVTGRWLLFATGGITAARFKVDSSGALGRVDDINEGALGWTVGAGAEYLAGEAVGIKLEYRYLQFGDFDFNPALGGGTVDIDFNMHSVLAGMNIYF